MKVCELIEALSKMPPDAELLVADEPIIDDDEQINESALQKVVALELGWCSRGIEWDITFSPREVPGYTKPAVRLLGYNDEPTDPNMKLTINGVEQVPAR